MTQRRTDKGFEELLEYVGASVRGKRTALGLSQVALGSKANLTDKFISRVETLGENLTLSSLSSLAKALEVEPGDLLPHADAPKEHPIARECKLVIDAAGKDKKTLSMMLELLKTVSKKR